MFTTYLTHLEGNFNNTAEDLQHKTCPFTR